jgi:hypothetical protein
MTTKQRQRAQVDLLVLATLINVLAALAVCLTTPLDVLRVSWVGFGWLVSAAVVYLLAVRRFIRESRSHDDHH